MEQNSASRIEQFHLEGGTKYNIFPKKWDFQNESGDFYKTKSATQSLFLYLAQIWGIVAAVYEGYGHTYDLPGKKLAPIDAELVTDNVFCLFSR